MKRLVEEKELGFGTRSFIGRSLSRFTMHSLAIDAINNYYVNASRYKGTDFTSITLSSLNIRYHISERDLRNIPVSGAGIVISNHPMGTLDGIMLIDAIGKLRKDVKILGNFLLMRIEPLQEFFFPVNPFNTRKPQNIPAIKKALGHLQNGGLLIIFPAGEVSTYQKGITIEDKEWSRSVMHFIRKSAVPVIPLYIDGSNSLKFHLAGKIHPVLRTIRLPLELKNKQNRNFRIRIGSPISPKRQSDLGDLSVYTAYLRANVYYMKYSLGQRKRHPLKQARKAQHPSSIVPVCSAVGKSVLQKEVAAIRSEAFLFRNGEYELYFTSSQKAPLIMQEIGRLREQTFREVGEGTNKALDTDTYDNYYKQLFIWDNANNRIIGGYRIGMGEEIISRHGIEGFYTHTLFNISGEFEKMLSRTIELGRSFIIKEFQKKPIFLMLLWKGILHVLLDNPHYRYLFGPVSMSGDYTDASKRIAIDYIKRNHFDEKLSKCIKPRHGIKGIDKTDVSLLKGIDNLDAIDKIVKDIEITDTLPILIKKYLQLNGRILAFNIDPDFNYSLDAFILLDLQAVPSRTLELLSKEMNLNTVRTRFQCKGI